MSGVKSALQDAEEIVLELRSRPGIMPADEERGLAVGLFKERHPNIAEAAEYFIDNALAHTSDLELYREDA